jgi:small subunit ribosomal protein S18
MNFTSSRTIEPIKVNTFTINYKNVNLLRHYISPTGKILPRSITKLTSKNHRAISRAIRQARRVGLLPFVWVI